MSVEPEQSSQTGNSQPLVFEHHVSLPDFMKTLMAELNSLKARVDQQDQLLVELDRVTEQLNQANYRIASLESENADLRAQLAQRTSFQADAGIYASQEKR